MADTQVLAHNDAYFSAESKSRLGAKSLGENVARNGSADDAHARLMASPGHRANLMSSKFSVVGIAVFRDGSGNLWITQGFVQPAAASAPAPAPAPAAAAPTTAPAPRPRTKPAPAPAPAPATPTTVQAPAAPTTQPTIDVADSALISAPGSSLTSGWSGSRPAPVAAAGTHMIVGAGHLVLVAACANALGALGAFAAWRRRKA